MITAKAIFGTLALGLSSFGLSLSTCQGAKSNGGEPVAKETTAARVDISLAGVDTSSLTPREKGEWSKYVGELLSPCSDVPVPLAQCVSEKRSCGKCLPAARYLVRQVREGLARDQVEKRYKNRFDPSKIKNVPIDGSPSRGPASAPITIIEFADFACPFCAMYAPKLEKVWEDHRTTIRMVYKFLPLASHGEVAERAARAAIAAWKEDKFWEMNKKLFANQSHFDPSDLEMYGKELGLSVDKFKASMQSDSASERLKADRALADTLDLKGTPSLFINGREFDAHDDIDEWIALELSMTSGEVASPSTSAPSASAKPGSAAPSASAKLK